jgi:hypothetical protein
MLKHRINNQPALDHEPSPLMCEAPGRFAGMARWAKIFRRAIK